MCSLYIAFGIYWYYPKFFARFRKRRALSYWYEIKDVINKFLNSENLTDSDKQVLEKAYSKNRNKLNIVVSTFHLKIQTYLNEKYQKRGARTGDIVFNNFKRCFSSSTLES